MDFEKRAIEIVKKITGKVSNTGYIYSGIYHDAKSGKAVATDGRCLFASDSLYDEQLNGLTVSTFNFKSLEGKFPEYEKVVKDKGTYTHMFENVEIPDIKPNGTKQVRIYIEDNGSFSLTRNDRVLACIDLHYLIMLQGFQKDGFTFDLYVEDDRTQVMFCFKADDSILYTLFIVMPIKII